MYMKYSIPYSANHKMLWQSSVSQDWDVVLVHQDLYIKKSLGGGNYIPSYLKSFVSLVKFQRTRKGKT